ncbi:Cell junction protein VAB-9 [Aphelenchoides fujianensis]|nr:Cell junction protein VAB-9 [Aphelenchoides fujianensis]
MPAQTTTIETVTVVRPLKVIAAICLLVFVDPADRLAVHHLLAEDPTLPHGPLPGAASRLTTWAPRRTPCRAPRSPATVRRWRGIRCSAYIIAVAVLLVIATVITFLGLVFNLLGLKSNDLHRKYLFYKLATYLSLFSVLCELTSLIVFPVCFFFTMHDYGVRNWDFDWSYGTAWSSMLFTFGASLLLICDKEHDEVYYKEKTIYNAPGIHMFLSLV